MPKRRRHTHHQQARKKTYLLELLNPTTGCLMYRFPPATEDQFIDLWMSVQETLSAASADSMSPLRAMVGISSEETVDSRQEDVMEAFESLIEAGFIRVTVSG